MQRRTRLPLNAADASLLALDRFMGSGGVGKNLVHLAVELDRAPDPAVITRALEQFSRISPWAGSRLRRGAPLFPPYWLAPRDGENVIPPIATHEVDTTDRQALGALLEARLDLPIDPFAGPPVRFDIVRSTAGSPHLLVLTWFHPLMDPRGAETFLLHLDRLASDDVDDIWPEGAPSFAAPERRGRFLDELQGARVGKKYLDSFRATPPRSPSREVAPDARPRFKLATFPTPTKVDRKRSEMTWRLATVGRAIRRIFGERIGDTPFLLPISVDLRKKGEPGPVFGNYLSLHFTQFVGTEEPSETVRELRTHMVEVVRDGTLDATMAAMHLIRGLPVSLLARRMAASTRGELASFHFADTGDYRGASPTLFGCTVENAYHTPTVTLKPGLGVFINRHAQTENIVVGWRDGGFDEAEIDALIADVAQSIGWDVAASAPPGERS